MNDEQFDDGGDENMNDEQLGDGGDEYKGYEEEPTHPQSLEMEPTPPTPPIQPSQPTEHAPNKRNNQNIQNTANEYFIVTSNIMQQCIERYWLLREHQAISYQEPEIGDTYFVNGIEVLVCSSEMIGM
ncbi:MAG: hypothetical protein GY737_02255 [Desulfobacteraceae bacterium]|nr:hypothetical protein [Desulfobacteraceae bacterium]